MSSHHDLSRVATRIPGRRFLQSPGPTPLPDAVLHALMGQPMDLGDPRVDQTIAACERGVQALLGQQPGAGGEVFFFIANGHGAWEAAVANFVPPGGLALLPGYLCEPALADGRLTHVLERWTPLTRYGTQVTLLATPERMRIARIRALATFLQQRLQGAASAPRGR